MTIQEEWKQLLDFPKYEVSNLGRLRRKKNNRVLKLSKNRTGYIFIRIKNKDKIRKSVSIHRLIAKTFLIQSEDLNQVDHIDRNKENNNLDNLRWCTAGFNMSNRKKISKDIIMEIIKLYKNGINEEEIISRFN